VAIDRSVRPVRPSWRADSLALAYVGGGGKAIVYDLAHESRSIAGPAAPITRLAFAPAGRSLVTATPGSALLNGKTVATGEIEAIGWLRDRAAVALESGPTPPLVRTFARTGRPLGGFRVPGRVIGLGGGLVLTRSRDKVLADRGEGRASAVLTVRNATAIEDLAIG
jgi:hypothetical protein